MTEAVIRSGRRPWRRYALLGASAGAACTLGMAAVEVSVLARSGVDGSEGPAAGLFLTYVALLGLIAPLTIAVGVLVGLLSAWVEPTPLGLNGSVSLSSDERRRFAVALFLTLPFAVGLWVVSASQASLLLFSSAAPPVAVAVLAAAATLLLAVLFVGATIFVARRLRDNVSPRLSPAAVGVSAALACVVAGLLLVALGETSGAGGPLKLFGVLRREELNLGPVASLALLGVLARVGLSLLQKLPNGIALALPVLALATLPVASRVLLEPSLPVQISRYTLLAKTTLRLFQSWSDRDGDGFGAHFGGGDCSDEDPAVNPAADDLPGNGVDEDCSGEDAPAPALSPAAPELQDAKSKEPSAQLPTDLNLLFITIDTLRYDLGFAGYARPVSPNIDALAKRSVLFENSYALASYTSKSLGPLLIGRYGSETHRGWLHFNRYPPQDRMLQERLQDAGIHTVSVQGHWYFDVQYGLGRGFDVLDMSAAPKSRQKEGDRTVNSEQLTDAALAELSRLTNDPKRFFMWVHYLDPHSEYVAHEQFNFGSDQRAKYDGEVAFTDHHVGRLLDALAASSLAKNTAVILTSDHGEAFGEHGMIRHGFELWEELIRVPLMIYVPGVLPRNEGTPRSAIDLAPTVLDLFGVPIPKAADGDFLSGESLRADLLLPPGEAAAPRVVFVDMQAGPYNSERQAFIEEGLKLVLSNSRPLGLYNLRTDPREKENLLSDSELVKKQLERFKQFRSKLKRVYVKPR